MNKQRIGWWFYLACLIAGFMRDDQQVYRAAPNTIPPDSGFDRISQSTVPFRHNPIDSENLRVSLADPLEVNNISQTLIDSYISSSKPHNELVKNPPPETYPTISRENSGKLIQIGEIKFSPYDLIMSVAFSPDGKTLAVSAGDSIYWYDLPSLEVIKLFQVGAFTHALVFSPDGNWLAAGSRDGYLRLWLEKNPESGIVAGDEASDFQSKSTQLFWLIQAHKKGVNSLVFHPNGRILASGGNDGVARLWDLDTGELAGMTIGGTFSIPSLAITPESGDLAILNGNVVRLRQVDSGRILGTILSETPLYSLAINPNQDLLAAGDLNNLVQLWNIKQAFHTGQEEYPESIKLIGHNGKGPSYRSLVWKVVFNPRGDLLASVGGDSTIRIWDVSTGELLSSLSGHVGGVTCVIFHTDGRTIVSGGLDGTVRFWGVSE